MSDSRVWLITGTSSGIGLALVKEVLATGERVAATTRRASPLAELAAAHSSNKLQIVEFDVGNPEHTSVSLFEKVHGHFGRIDVVINSAGYGLNGVVEGTSDEAARDQFEVNFWGPVRISREAVKYFREHNAPSQGGRIINVSSVGGFNANPTLAFYSASKFALEGFSEGLHKELDPEWNIKVLVVQPGGVRTDWNKGSMVDLPLPPAYDKPDSVSNRMRTLYKDTPCMGDAHKLSRALIKLSREANPPLRLPMGADAQFIILNKLADLKKEVEQWDELELASVADDADPDFFKKLSVVTDANKH